MLMSQYILPDSAYMPGVIPTFDELEKNPNAKFGLELGKQPGNSEFSNLQKDIDITNKDHKQQSFEDKILDELRYLNHCCLKGEQFYQFLYLVI